MTNQTHDTGVRCAAVHELLPGTVARGQNFWVQWLEGSATAHASSGNEMLLLLPDGGATVHSRHAQGLQMHDTHLPTPVHPRHAEGLEVQEPHVPGRSVCVLPPGAVSVRLAGAGRAALIASSRPDLPPDAACNRADYAVPDARVRPLGADDCYRRRTPSMALQVMEVDAIASPAEKPRLKMFQTDTLSINWVEYQGPRD